MRSTAILIPTFNQPQAFEKCIYLIAKWTKSSYKIYVIDNSVEKYAEPICNRIAPNVKVLKPEKNLGWMGGINLGIKESTEEFVCFLNDDCFPIEFQEEWLQKMLRTFSMSASIGAVGPVSNEILPFQNIHNSDSQQTIHLSPILSGMCFLTRRSIIEKIGLLDETLPGADDLDYSIRLLNEGYVMAIRRDVFFYHYGSLTGRSIHKNFYNSEEQQDGFRHALIRKHGLKNFLKLRGDGVNFNIGSIGFGQHTWEKEEMRKWCMGKGADIGCGAYKTVPDAIGVDLTPKDSYGTGGSQLYAKSQADITITDLKLPFNDSELDYVVASHVLEHIVDDMAALSEWVRVLKPGGYLIVAVPDEDKVDGLPLDPTHKHTYHEEALKRKLGYITQYEVMTVNKRVISMVMIFRISK